jgi:hypothetical protein
MAAKWSVIALVGLVLAGCSDDRRRGPFSSGDSVGDSTAPETDLLDRDDVRRLEAVAVPSELLSDGAGRVWIAVDEPRLVNARLLVERGQGLVDSGLAPAAVEGMLLFDAPRQGGELGYRVVGELAGQALASNVIRVGPLPDVSRGAFTRVLEPAGGGFDSAGLGEIASPRGMGWDTPGGARTLVIVRGAPQGTSPEDLKARRAEAWWVALDAPTTRFELGDVFGPHTVFREGGLSLGPGVWTISAIGLDRTGWALTTSDDLGQGASWSFAVAGSALAGMPPSGLAPADGAAVVVPGDPSKPVSF